MQIRVDSTFPGRANMYLRRANGGALERYLATWYHPERTCHM